MEKTIKEVISAIENGSKIEDSRGIVYRQEFGEAFLNKLKETVKLQEKPEPTVLGYFKHGGVKWHTVKYTNGFLKGIDITSKGKIHSLNIHEDEVYELVWIEN